MKLQSVANSKGWPPGQWREAPWNRRQLAREKLSIFAAKTAKMLCIVHAHTVRRFESRVNRRSPGCLCGGAAAAWI